MAKAKMKSHRGASKRFKLTGTGKVKRNKAYKSHILTKKTAKRKRGLFYVKTRVNLPFNITNDNVIRYKNKHPPLWGCLARKI